jgi:hypothetical protein
VHATLYVLRPLLRSDADALRSAGGITYVADSKPGYPCRQCLQDAEIGEELLLVSYDPFDVDSPYRSASPIFLHKTACALKSMSSLPEQLTIRQLSVRAFDANAMMTDAVVIEGTDLDATLTQMFADDDNDVVHVHNAVRGCWATNVARNRSHG